MATSSTVFVDWCADRGRRQPELDQRDRDRPDQEILRAPVARDAVAELRRRRPLRHLPAASWSRISRAALATMSSPMVATSMMNAIHSTGNYTIWLVVISLADPKDPKVTCVVGNDHVNRVGGVGDGQGRAGDRRGRRERK